MSPIEDDRLILKIAQFKLLNAEIKLEDEKMIELVLQGLDLNAKVPDTNFLKKRDYDGIVGDSLLHLAYQEENEDLYNSLILKGADFNNKDGQGNTVIHRAFYNFCCNYHNMYKLDFQKVKFNSYTKFIVATLSAHVKYNNTNNPSDSNGLTHFHIACGTNNTEAVEFFLKNGAEVNQAVIYIDCSDKVFLGYTPLHFAAEFGYIEVVKILLKHGANTTLKNNEGQTPLHVSLKRNIEIIDSAGHVHLPSIVEINEQIMKLLLKHNVNPKFSNLFVVSAMKDSVQTANFLAHGIDVNQSISMDSQIWPGYTALHFASLVNVDTVKLLIKRGANIEVKEANGLTPLDMCIERYKVEDILDILCLIPSWRNIVLSDGKTQLIDLLGSFLDVNDIGHFLKFSKDNVKLFVPFDSPLWPGFTVLHLALLLTDRKKCKTDYNYKKRTFDPDLRIITECLKQDADVTIQDHHNWTPVHFAFRHEKKMSLDLLLQHHHKVKNCVTEQNLSHLHIACKVNNEDLVKKLVWNDADVNIVYTGDMPISSVYPGWTPLHVAVCKKHYNIVKLLLQFGADIYIPDTYGFTAIHQLMHCYEYKKLSEILFNVSNLRDFIIEDIGLSYLHIACATNNVKAVKQLLDLGADVNKAIVSCTKDYCNNYPRIRVKEGYTASTPLHFALENYNSNRSELLRLLIERGADIFAKKLNNNSSPLSLILDYGYGHFLDVIIEAFKRNVDLQKRAKAEIGLTMLHVACRKLDIDWIEELLDSGADINAQIHEDSTFWPKFTALHVLLESYNDMSGYHSNVAVGIKLLLDHNADVTLSNNNGDTPLHVAYCNLYTDQLDDGNGSLNNVISLLQAHKKFDVNPISIEGLSHFHIACNMLEAVAVENFLEHGVDVNLKTDVFCSSEIAASAPLHLVTKSGQAGETESLSKLFSQLKIIDALIKNGADVNAQDVFGNTPAHYAGSCSSSTKNLLQRLANSGADVNAQNAQGETPLELLLTKGDFSPQEARNFITFGCRFNAFNPVTRKGYIALADFALSHNDMQSLLFGAYVNSPDMMKVDDMKRTGIHNLVSISKPRTNQNQYNDLFDIFMTFGCDIDDQDDLGRTALHLAALFKNEFAVSGLLLAGADINITDHSGKTPFAYVFEPCFRCDQDHDQYYHTQLFNIFVTHMKKMELCDVYVNKSNVALLDNAFEKINFSFILNNLDAILPEMAQIAFIKVQPYSLTVADFVSAAVAVIDYPTMSLVKRRAIDAFFRTNKRTFELRLQQMSGILQLQYRQAVLRRKIIDEAKESLRVLARYRLPDICSHIILRSLTNFELQNLIASTAKNQVTNMDVDY